MAAAGSRWQSAAVFRCDTEGTVDVGHSAPLEGDWKLADAGSQLVVNGGSTAKAID